jgi:DNA-binding LacI/PurR family transcriptional regulator
MFFMKIFMISSELYLNIKTNGIDKDAKCLYNRISNIFLNQERIVKMLDSRDKAHTYSYSAIEMELEQKIRQGFLLPNARVPSENELSREYGVSRMSARQALTNLVVRNLLYRIAGKGTFVSPSKPEAENTILGLVLNNLGNPFFPQLTKTIQRKALIANYDVIYYANNDLIDESKSIDILVKRKVAGVIIVPSQEVGEESLVEKLDDAGIPFVYLNRFLKKPESDYVITDNARGADMALEYLYSLGHRKIGFVAASPYTSVIAERLESYNHFIRDHDLCGYSSVQISHQKNEEGGYEAGKAHLSSANKPTAIFCGNDITAVGVLKAAAELRINVPNDLSIVGYDDIDLATHLSPPLTTVSQPTERMAEMAIDLLISRLRQERKEERKQVVIPSKLIIRDSCTGI